MTLTPLPKPDDPIFGPLRRKLTKGIMVQWINADLIHRAGCDVRRSIVLWDADGDFVMALPASLDKATFLARISEDGPCGDTLRANLERLGIQHWTVGI